MNDMDMTSQSGQVRVSPSGATVDFTEIASQADIEQYFPEYSGRVSMPPSYAGLDSDDPPEWEQDSYKIEPGAVVGRLLASLDDCVLLVPDDSASNPVEPLSPEPFGSVIIGQLQTDQCDRSGDELTVSNCQYLIVAYSSALLITRYEKELSTRVLSNAPSTVVDSIDRKYMKAKRQLRQRMQSGRSGVTVTVPHNQVTVYSVSCEDEFSSIFNDG